MLSDSHWGLKSTLSSSCHNYFTDEETDLVKWNELCDKVIELCQLDVHTKSFYSEDPLLESWNALCP